MTEPLRLGATVTDAGTTFVVASGVAERIELCLFADLVSSEEPDRVDLVEADGTWTATVAGVRPGQAYGYRVHGPGDPANGHACDPAKLLVDPGARRVAGELRWAPELTAPGVDSAPFVPRSVVVAPPSAPVERPTMRPWSETFAYEAHVGHLTARHGLVPTEARGRYAGLAAPPVVDHLLRLGITAVELLPVQHFVSELVLVASGRRNVWGYNPLAWGAPHAGYASAGGDPVAELRAAVAALHDAGIEVWLDVVYNHTCEGSLGSGPILSWRGFDNAAAYRLIDGRDGRVDDDVTGCGNAIDTGSPWVRRLIRESLVRWVDEIGVDGFRFDLASTLIRGDDGPSPEAPLLAELAAEPRLQGIRLIAEPWDTGPGGYALGRFPPPWREWNDRFRDHARTLWRGEAHGWSQTAARATGSADSFRHGEARDATAGVNAVSTHDGFTVADLVTYAHPVGGGHGQGSSNAGLEGPTADPTVVALRRRRQRALIGTVLVAQGVPMISSGDELGRTQGGRADGYTLEPAEWGLPWSDGDWDLVSWVAAAAQLRAAHPALRWPAWVDPGDPLVRWLAADGTDLSHHAWNHGGSPALQILLTPRDDTDRSVLVVLAPTDDATCSLPPGRWRVALDSAVDRGMPVAPAVVEGDFVVEAPALVVLVAQP